MASMGIEFAVKSLQSFIRDVRAEARAVSNNKEPRDLPQENTMRVYFRNQDEVDEAYAALGIGAKAAECIGVQLDDQACKRAEEKRMVKQIMETGGVALQKIETAYPELIAYRNAMNCGLRNANASPCARDGTRNGKKRG